MECGIDGTPPFTARTTNKTGILRRPVSCLAVVEVGPSENPGFGKGRQISKIADAQFGFENSSQAASSRKSATSIAEGSLNSVPGFAFRSRDRPGKQSGPVARIFVMFYGPADDLGVGQLRKVASVPDATMFFEKAGQRTAGPQAPLSVR